MKPAISIVIIPVLETIGQSRFPRLFIFGSKCCLFLTHGVFISMYVFRKLFHCSVDKGKFYHFSEEN